MKTIQALIEKKQWVMLNGTDVMFTAIEDNDILSFKISFINRLSSVPTAKIIPRNEIDSFKKQIIPTMQHQEVIISRNQAVVDRHNETFLKLSEGLVSDFDKLKEDPGYIAQAKQRSDSVKTIIEMSKVQIELVKTIQNS